MELAEREVQGPLVSSQLAQAIDRQIDALSNTDSGSAHQQQRLGRQVVGAAQLLLEQVIVLQGERCGQITRQGRQVSDEDESGLDRIAISSQVMEQATKSDQVTAVSRVAQGRLAFTQPAEPAEQVRIAAQLGEPAHLRKGAVEIGEETARDRSVVTHGVGPQGQSQGLNMRCKDVLETLSGVAHGIWGADKRLRFWTARAYSRQTSWGANWT